MSADKAIDVRVTANIADLKRGMSEAPNAVDQATSRMRGSFRKMQEETQTSLRNMRDSITDQVSGMTGPLSGLVGTLSKVRLGFVAIAAAAVTIGMSKSVGEAAEMTESALDLSRALGITTNEASILQAALEDVGASPGEFEAAAKGLSRQLRANEDDMKALGLATRDANGDLRPMTDLVLDSVGILNQYREGADRAIAAQTLFGRGVDASSKLLLLNRDTLDENREAVEELGLMVGENSVEAWKDFDAATDRAGLSLKGMVKAVGQSLMPVLTDLVRLFNAVMPAAIVVVRVALSGLTAAFLSVKNGVIVLWEIINAMVISVAEPVRALAVAIARAMSGDFAGAAASIKGIGGNIAGGWERAMERITESSVKTSKTIKGLFVPDTGTARGGVSGDRTSPEEKDKPKRTGGGKGRGQKQEGLTDVFDNGSFLASDKDTVSFIKRQYDDVNNLQREMVKSAEKAAKEMMQIDLLRAQSARDIELSRIAEAEASARHQVDMGIMSVESLLALQTRFNDQRLTAEQLYIDRKKEIALLDPDRNPAEIERIELEKMEIRRRYAQQGLDIQRQQAMESNAIWTSLTDSISGLWDKGVNAMMQGTLTWSNAIRAIGAEMANWFMTNVVGKMIKDWLAAEVKKLAMKMGFIASEKAAETTAAATTIATKGTETTAVVAGNAAQAGSGAAASQASIPFVGPMLALAAMAAVFAAVSALGGGGKKSAAGGYDIPAGVNPLTQLHAEEMVLPKPLANAVRKMAASGSEGGNQISLTMHIQTKDADSFRASEDQISAEMHARLADLQRGV